MEQNLGGLSYEPYDVFVPLGVPDTVRTRFNESYIGLARLQPGISFSKAQTFMGIITERGFQAAFVGPNRKQNGRGVFLVPYRDFLGGSMKTPMLILWAAVTLVLVIACSNIAGLTLARASTRTRELAVRATLGGTWWHLIRQTLAESLMLAAGGSIMGVGVAYLFDRAVAVLGAPSVASGLQNVFGFSALTFAAGTGLLCGILLGLVPAGQLARMRTSEGLKEGGRSGTPSRNRLWLRSVLVATEVALALVLSVGAGLFLQSLLRLQRVETGFRPQGAVSAMITLPSARYKEPEKQIVFYRGVIEKLSAAPGTISAAAIYPLPFTVDRRAEPSKS